MSGTRLGGKKGALTNIAKYGFDFYKNIGKKGGQAKTSKPKGFAANPELARKAGAKGGAISTRKGVKNGEGQSYWAIHYRMKKNKDCGIIES